MNTENSESISLEEILANTPEFIFWKDKHSIYLGCNKNFALIAGLKNAKDIIGKTDNDLPWSKSYSNIYLKEDRNILETGIPLEQKEVPLVTAQGDELIVIVSKSPLCDVNGRIVGILGIYIDITSRKKMELDLKNAKEAAEIANKTKTAFIANMSHDVRTPLSGVIGMAEILEKEGDSEKDREYGQIIHNSSEQLLSLLNDILEIISAEEVNEEKLTYQTFSLSERVKHIKDLFFSIAESKQVVFKIYQDKNLPPYITTDRIKLDRILLNLISNALKFTEHGYVKLSTKLISIENDEVVIKFKVIDTGIGISKEKIKHIFDCFYKATPSFEGKYRGYGIGLYVVKRFVELLGGEVTVVSEPGQGSVFTVTLPVKIGREEDQKEINSNFKITNTKDGLTQDEYAKKITKSKVLFVEDDNIARRTGQYILEATGFTVYAVPSGEDAFNAMKTNHYDLIVCDIGLPGIDGNELTFLVRRWEKKLGRAPIPIIALSAHTSASNKEECLKIGMNAVLEKPLNQQKVNEIFLLLTEIENNQSSIQKPETKALALGPDLPETEEELLELEKFPILDEKSGLAIIGSKKMLRNLLAVLVEETIPNEEANLERAHNINDWEKLQKLAHKLKGAALYCGTIKLRFACQFLEQYYSAGHRKLLEKLYQQLIVISKDTKLSVRNYLEKQ